MGHTPTPWYVTERGEECHISNSPTVDEDGDLPDSCYWIAMTMGSATDDGDDNANADLIVRAVNFYNELVEALEQIAAFDDEGANKHLEATGSYSSFDEPSSVRIARSMLSRIKAN